MATVPVTETLFEGNNILVVQVTVPAASDASDTEHVVVDLSTLTGPQGGGSGGEVPATGQISLLEASWAMSSVWEGAQLYWHDETNNDLILEMVGDSAASFRGIGGKHYGAETEAGDGDVLIDMANAEAAAGSAQFLFVFKKKQV
jgi:hypothetical protein